MKLDELRPLISSEIKALEQGEFQDFCKLFLPLINTAYKDLERFGGTASGKTRKGTPDLIKTLQDGTQIAVQCSTAKDYWIAPKDFSNWKPCSDIDICLEKLKNVQEIVLCSNKEKPTDKPNCETEIINYAKTKSKAKITVISLATIENTLTKNIELNEHRDIFRIFVPQVYQFLDQIVEAQKSKLQIELVKQYPIPLEAIEEIVKEGFKAFSESEKAREYIIEKISDFPSRFETKPIPSGGEVKRNIPPNRLFLDPIGTIHSLIGVPKIGKTTLIAQCVNTWKDKNNIVRWFTVPTDSRHNSFFIEELIKNILTLVFSPDKALEFAREIRVLNAVDPNGLTCNLDKPLIYIIDNVENLADGDIDILTKYLEYIKRSPIADKIGLIFISNRAIKYRSTVVVNEQTVVAWDNREMGEFLLLKLPEYKENFEGKYIEHLNLLSGGHPLIALALAKKYPSIDQLILATFTSPSVTDEDLAQKVKKFLFNDILGSSQEAQKLVIRMSALISSAKDKLMEAIVNKVSPSINEPIELILDRLLGTVIEGNKDQGYYVAHIYKKVAQEKISAQERKLIYKAITSSLLDPNEKRPNVIDTIDGIYYAILAEEFEKGFYWALILLSNLEQQKPQKNQIINVLSRLSIVAFITPRLNSGENYLHCGVLLKMSMLYSNIGEYEESLRMIKQLDNISAKVEDKALKGLLILLKETTKLFEAIVYSQKDPVQSIRLISDITFRNIQRTINIDSMILDLIRNLASRISPLDIPDSCLKSVIHFVDLNDEKVINSLVAISTIIGVKAKKENVDIERAKNKFDSDKDISEILKLIAEAQYNLEKANYEPVIKKIEQAFNMCLQKQMNHESINSSLYNLEGDAYYGLKQIVKAKQSYLNTIENTKEFLKTLDYGWANYRLGLLSSNPAEAKKYFEKSTKIFKGLNFTTLYPKSEGETGITLFQLDDFQGFIDLAETICSKYYLHKREEYGAVCAIMLAHLTRFVCVKEKRPVPEGEGMVFPEFKRGVYDKVLDLARPNIAGLMAFEALAKCYGLINNQKKKIESLRHALSFKARTPLESSYEVLVIRDLLNEIFPNGDIEEIKQLMIRAIALAESNIHLPISTENTPRDYVIFAIFYKLDEFVRENKDMKNLIKILTELEKEIKNLELKNNGWWLSEICMRKARTGQVYYSNDSEKYQLWKEAYSLGKQEANGGVVFEAAFSLGFFYIRYSRTIKETTDIQLDIVQFFNPKNQKIEDLEMVGNNLFNVWKKVNIVRLYEQDLNVKREVVDIAKSLMALDIPVEEAGVVMILVLSSFYEYKGFATEWAATKIKNNNIASKLQKEVIEKIKSYF